MTEQTLPTYASQLSDGTEYTGIQQYRGNGLQKWCALCGQHRAVGGGSIKPMLGGKHWCCSKHPKAVK